MPAFLVSILGILGVVGQMAPVVEQLLSGLGTFISNEVAKLAGASSGADTFLSGIITQVEDGVKLLDTAATDMAAEIEAIYPTVKELFAAFPGLAQSLSLRSQVMADTGLSHGTASKLVEVAHSNVRVAAAPKP